MFCQCVCQTLIATCLNIVLSEDSGTLSDSGSVPSVVHKTDSFTFKAFAPPKFCSATIKLTALQMHALKVCVTWLTALQMHAVKVCVTWLTALQMHALKICVTWLTALRMHFLNVCVTWLTALRISMFSRYVLRNVRHYGSARSQGMCYVTYGITDLHILKVCVMWLTALQMYSQGVLFDLQHYRCSFSRYVLHDLWCNKCTIF